MGLDKIKEAIKMGEDLQHIFVVTADKEKVPHLAAAGKISLMKENTVAVTSWFCPATVVNLKENKHISLVVWDEKEDKGFQLLGDLEDMQDLGILDGFAPDIESKSLLPQVQRQLFVRINKIIEFKHAPHSDV